MAGEHVAHTWRLPLGTFHAFRDEQPKYEKWELIDGRPTMMAPPTLIHQRIARNLETLLNARLAIVRPEWQADREIGLLLPLDERYNPEPDVTVIDTAIGSTQVYADRFYVVAEVLSPNDKDWVLDAKLGYYQGHALCRAIRFVEQARIACRVWQRIGVGTGDSTWQESRLDAPLDRIALPDIGDIGPLAALYRHTPLDVGPT
jgi:Uma2 family endonuclease